MEATNFAKYLSDFFAKYLPGERNVSHNTILAYKDTFVQFITFMKEQKSTGVQKLTLEKITKETVMDFLDWLQQSRHCSNATRNNRLAAIRSFLNYLQYENPERLFEWQKIISIKVKQHQKKSINYLTTDGIKLLLEQPDISTRNGRRNLALLALMYDSGARVQEMHLLEPHANLYPLFSNTRNVKLTRAGITYILKTYADQARKINPGIIPETISCHSLRHSKAMHLLQAGVNLVYIRDILGHVSVQTTDIYARADSKQKRDAFEKVYVEMKPEKSKDKSWEKDDTLLEWLKNLKK